MAEAEKMAQEIARLEGALASMEEARDDDLFDLEAARDKITDLDTNLEAAHGDVETLKDTVKQLTSNVETLKDKVDDLEDQVADLDAALSDEKTFNEATRAVVAALEIYLSWLDNPPPNMVDDAKAQFLTSFRRDLDAALREVR